MIYKNFHDKKLSALGLGCMRFPMLENKKNDGDIDEVRTAEMFDLAIKNGINYFDTAWGYHNGCSEPVVGKMLSKYPRESFYLATKFPGYDLGNMGKAEEIFEKQLERLRTDYIDFYLFHTVSESNYKHYLNDEKYGDFSYFVKQKELGRIKHIGFSIHASLEIMKEFLEAYGKHIDFVQIQLNYIDWNYQDAKAKVEVLNQMNIPIWVMEPVRGGRLATTPLKYESVLEDIKKGESAPALAFRFLQSIQGVTMVLSGMSSKEQLLENIKTFSEEKPLTADEFKTLVSVGDDMMSRKTLPCTSCNYCVPNCPAGIDIPSVINVYNEFAKGETLELEVKDSKGGKPSECIACKACEAVCPQQIKISETMSSFLFQ
ncbi:MAG: 4Fe-4S dicluster domain-containing protein [Ruminococcaceae bacterium]|nr:4Fe-4S dicluster domain-containing protein [Oscillospiraceae bacterium]